MKIFSFYVYTWYGEENDSKEVLKGGGKKKRNGEPEEFKGKPSDKKFFDHE